MFYLHPRPSQTTRWRSSWLLHARVSHRYPTAFPQRLRLLQVAAASSTAKGEREPAPLVGELRADAYLDRQWPLEIFASEPIRDRRSVFQAHATELRDAALLPFFLDHLTSLSSLKRATHCMYAYRSKEKNNGMERVACGQNDGGESGSGDRLARLLELSNCDEVLVVVSRWYGGTKLGSDRWKHISQVAKEALSKGGFSGRKDPPQGTAGKKKRRK